MSCLCSALYVCISAVSEVAVKGQCLSSSRMPDRTGVGFFSRRRQPAGSVLTEWGQSVHGLLVRLCPVPARQLVTFCAALTPADGLWKCLEAMDKTLRLQKSSPTTNFSVEWRKHCDGEMRARGVNRQRWVMGARWGTSEWEVRAAATSSGPEGQGG